MELIPMAEWERTMKVQDVILRAMAKKITWWQSRRDSGNRRPNDAALEWKHENESSKGRLDGRKGRPNLPFSLMFFREHELLDGPAFDEMFLNDALEHCGSHRVIPRALWINHRNRSLVTDAKAIRLRTINGVFRSRESQLFQSLF